MRIGLVLLSAVFAIVLGTSDASAAPPNVLFIIADDASRHFGEAYRCKWAKTPNIDRLASNGLVFDNAYTPTSKCAPSRAAILTGRNPWLLEDAANHQPEFPAKFKAFSESLADAGFACGGAGKTWGPGQARLADGRPRDFALKVRGGKQDVKDPGAGLTDFLKSRSSDRPFFYWFGSHLPHRAYVLDSGVKAGKSVNEIERVPGYWPDNHLVRRDMLDYAIEVEQFDAQVGSLLTALEASGEAKNTLVIVTSDHGMPFPRVKGHTYDDAHHIPLIASWPEGIEKPGRRVAEFVSFIDLAPTILELFGVDGVASGMSPIVGASFVDLLKNKPARPREFVIVGRERNDVDARPGSPSGLGYPARAIRSENFFYVHNFEPDRWPCGNEELGFKDTDASPTKTFVEELGDQSPFWQHAFGKRPQEQLFDLSSDPDCVQNLAKDAAFQDRVTKLRETLFAELKRQGDPRMSSKPGVFDQYLSPKDRDVVPMRKQPKPTKKAN